MYVYVYAQWPKKIYSKGSKREPSQIEHKSCINQFSCSKKTNAEKKTIDKDFFLK